MLSSDFLSSDRVEHWEAQVQLSVEFAKLDELVEPSHVMVAVKEVFLEQLKLSNILFLLAHSSKTVVDFLNFGKIMLQICPHSIS